MLHPNIIVHVEHVVSLFSSPSTSSHESPGPEGILSRDRTEDDEKFVQLSIHLCTIYGTTDTSTHTNRKNTSLLRFEVCTK